MKPITWSFGMQSRGTFHIGDDPDLEGAVEAAAEAGMTEAIIFGKDHTGFCFHPTKIGTPHPHLKINLTGRMTELLHQHGMKSIAYVNFGLDGEMGRRHREWVQQSEPGQDTLYTEDHFVAICIFTSYLDEYLIPVIEEMFTDYGIDGVFLDQSFAFEPCYCSCCAAAFQQKFGRPLPRRSDPDDPGWPLFSKWQFVRAEGGHP